MGKLVPREESFDEMSRAFKDAYGCSSNGYYEQSILLYKRAIEQDNHNFAAWNNIAVAKIFIALKDRNVDLLDEAAGDLKEAIRIVNEVYDYSEPYALAVNNLAWLEGQKANLN